METAVSFVSLFRLSHKTDIMLLMSLWPISVLPFDICPTETKTFAQKRNMSNFFLSASILWPDQHVQKLYSISCYEIKFSSDLLSLVDLAKDQTIFVFYQSGDKQTNAFFTPARIFLSPPPILHPPYTLTISTTPN